MGIINHGTQKISHEYYEEIIANNRNVRLKDILPRGIYSGGYLEKVSNTEIKFTAGTVEIGDNNVQVRIKTSSDATLNDSTLDSGYISPATPYIILRWGYIASKNNYMEIHAVASTSAAQTNDIIVGKVVFSGSTITSFSYVDRTFTNMQDLFLKPEQIGTGTTMYVRIRSGKIHSNSGYVLVPVTPVGPFTAPSAPNSRTDIVWVAADGTLTVTQGTPAISPTAPTYGGKLVIAEITIPNGATGITSSMIKDVRSFISPSLIIDNSTIQVNSSGKLEVNTNNSIPKWNVIVADNNNLTTPAQFDSVSPLATFSMPSFGSIYLTTIGYHSWWMLNNSARFRMKVNVASLVTKTLKLFVLDDAVRFYVDGSLVFSRTSVYVSPNVPLNVSLSLAAGERTIDIVFNDKGGVAYLNVLGDIIDGSNVKFVE